MKLKSVWLFTLLGMCVFLKAQVFDFNANCQNAYQNIIALKLDAGQQFLNIENQKNPSNYIPILLNNYIDFLSVYTSGSLKEYETVKKQLDSRIGQLKKGNTNSPYYLYSQAEIHIHAAVLHIKFGEYVACVFDIRKALKKLEENQAAFPNFEPNNKSLGLLYTILGSIPQQYQTGLEFIGLSGNVNHGLQLLKQSATQNNEFKHEAATIYAFMLLHIQNEPDKAWNYLKTQSFNPVENLMDAYSFGHIGIYGTHNDEGITALLNRPKGSQYILFPMCDYLLGLGKTYKLDKDANVYFQKFLQYNQGEDYIKASYNKMAWNDLVNGNLAQYNQNIQKVAIKGRAVVDTDKQAQHEAENGKTPNTDLLKLRLLTDGNYTSQALELIKKLTVNSFNRATDKTEYYYRLARLFDKMHQVAKASSYYKLTISNGKDNGTYFAANAAYLLGFLFEKQGSKEEAVQYYKTCLQLNGYEYDNSIHQKAEAGLNRIK